METKTIPNMKKLYMESLTILSSIDKYIASPTDEFYTMVDILKDNSNNGYPEGFADIVNEKIGSYARSLMYRLNEEEIKRINYLYETLDIINGQVSCAMIDALVAVNADKSVDEKVPLFTEILNRTINTSNEESEKEGLFKIYDIIAKFAIRENLTDLLQLAFDKIAAI